jgi:hypothetical protein
MLNKMTRKIVTMMGTGAAIALFSFSAHSANMLTNGDFDAQDASGGDIFGSTGWGTFGSGFTTQNSLPADSPLNSFKAFGAGAGAGQTFAATAGDMFAGSGVGLVTTGQDAMVAPGEMFLQVVFTDINGNFAGTEAGGNFALGFNVFNGNILDSTTPTDVWTELGVGTAAAPDNTAFVTFNVLVLAPAGGAGYFDSTSFDVAAVPVPAAAWLFGSALLGLMGISRRAKS